MPVRVRFAPSPTGFFSLGNARTALFNWVFAKHEGGKFLLRIEDTDKERSKKEYEEDILEGLKWLGLNWDEEVVRQSERLDIYEKYLLKLIEEKKAYYCFCTPQELEEERQLQLSQGLIPKYSGKCRNIPLSEAQEKAKFTPFVIRLKMPSSEVSFNDLIRGKITVNLDLIGDVIIAKGLRSPLYNFAVVVDDYEMNITHVIRGEDHISNTPIQLVLYEFLNIKPPFFAHLPLILGPDKKKLSKRYLDTSLKDFREKGYLKEALINFLLLLGWHPKVDKEIVSLEEAVADFDFKKVQKKGAIFNEQKLLWLNAYYIKKSSPQYLLEYVKKFVPESWLKDEEKVLRALEVEKERLKILSDFTLLAQFIFEEKDYDTQLLFWKDTPVNVIIDNLSFAKNVIQEIPDDELWQIENIRKYIMSAAEMRGRGELLWPLRVALSGEKSSPDPTQIIYILGKEESIRRINKALDKLSAFREKLTNQ